MKRVLFIDRDGTLIIEPPDEQLTAWKNLSSIRVYFQRSTTLRKQGNSNW